jgi:hypothetical protein
MTVLLDENVPRKLKWRLVERGLEVVTVPERGWSGIGNGELLSRAEGEFDALLTMDQGIEHQQEVAGRNLALVVVKASSNEYETLLPLIPGVVEALRHVDAGTVASVTA